MLRDKRLALAITVAALPLAVASAAGIDTLLWGGVATRAVVEKISDPLSILDARSPGARRAGALLQTKPGHARALAAGTPPGGPADRVLAGLRDNPNEADLVARLPALLASNRFAEPDVGPGGAVPGLVPTPAAFTPSDFGAFPPPGGLLPPPVQSPPGASLPGGAPPGRPASERTALGVGAGPPGGGPVPEPTTWVMMIMAMFAVGAALRWRWRKPVDA